jgi:SAM-dependent methyltransferase
VSPLVPPRRPTRERLDDPDLPPEEMRRSLEDLDLVNRRWGASRALEQHLLARAKALGRTRISILDVGAGSGDVAWRLVHRLREAGLAARVVATDLQWRHLAVGRLTGAAFATFPVAGDALRLPFRDGAFDFVVSTLFWHHFSPAQNRQLLDESRRVARLGFAMLDVRRHRLAELFVALAGRIIFRTRVSVEDGVASVRQGYTPGEALAVAREVEPASLARRIFPFRFLVAGGRACRPSTSS